MTLNDWWSKSGSAFFNEIKIRLRIINPDLGITQLLLIFPDFSYCYKRRNWQYRWHILRNYYFLADFKNRPPSLWTFALLTLFSGSDCWCWIFLSLERRGNFRVSAGKRRGGKRFWRRRSRQFYWRCRRCAWGWRQLYSDSSRLARKRSGNFRRFERWSRRYWLSWRCFRLA